MATLKQIFLSIDEQVAAADVGWKAGRPASTTRKPSEKASFIGRRFANWADVQANVGQAWQEGLDEVQWMLFELRKAALPTITCQKRRPRFSDDGDEVDHDRLRSGQEYWRTMRRESVVGPQTFCVVADLATNCRTASMDILWRGAVAIVLADLLEEQGHRVELWVVSHGQHSYTNGADSFIATRVKATDQPVDIATLTNAVSGWFFRTVVFQNICGEFRGRATDGMGKAQTLSASDPELQELAGPARLTVVAGVWNKDSALKFASRMLETIDQ